MKDEKLAKVFFDQLQFKTTIQLLADTNQILDGYDVPDFDHLVNSDRERLYLRAIYLASYYKKSQERIKEITAGLNKYGEVDQEIAEDIMAVIEDA